MKKFTRKQVLLILLLALAVAILIIFRPGKFVPNIISVTPTNGSRDVPITTQIEIIFEDSVPQNEQEKFFVRLVPGISSNTVWISPKLLRIVPTQPLVSQTPYRITVLYDSKEIFNSSFETIFIKQYTTEEIEEINNMALETAAAFYQMNEAYPFLQKLPVEKDNYRVVYDFDRDEFRIRLLMPSTAPEETKQEALDTALVDLQSLDINVSDYGYYVLYSE